MSAKQSSLQLYKEHFIEKEFERLGLFQLLADKYYIKSVLYPGSFVHITPSFVFPKTVYVDTDKRANKFFSDPKIYDYINKRKTYSQEADISFYSMDYRNELELENESFDLIISQYAGFVSQHCKRNLKIGGILLVNNSHGDASMASLDDDYELISVIAHRNRKYNLSDKNLELYFIPKREIYITKEYIAKIQKGIGYKKTSSAYIFRRIY